MIDRYFLTAFCVQEPYILLEGIETADTFLSDSERNARQLAYYAIDTTDDSIIGPFETASSLLASLNLDTIDWTPITDPPNLPNVRY